MPARPRYVNVLLFVVGSVFASGAFGQDYRMAIGARFGYGWGLSVKGVLGSKIRQQSTHAIDGMIRYGYHGVVFTQPGINFAALYEKHFPFGRYENWAFYLGGGPSMGVGKLGSLKIFTVGIGPVVGLEVTAPRIPINFALDYKPSYYFDKHIKRETKENTFSFYELGFSVRFALQ
jgi:hypothetical protein